MKPVILFKPDIHTQDEYDITKSKFETYHYRSQIPPNSLVIPRYRYATTSIYHELSQDIKNLGSNLLNSYASFYWVANFDYYQELKHLTFETWTEKEYPYAGYDGPVVIKGLNNSRKHQWNSHCYAKNKKEAIRVASELANDPLIGPQGLIYRKYIPLKTFETDFTGLPISNEWRFFFYKNALLSYGYYWSNAEKPELGYLTKEAFDLVHEIATIAQQYTNYYTIDIAEKEEGGWILVELNDGGMSGLSLNDAETLYSNLKKALS